MDSRTALVGVFEALFGVLLGLFKMDSNDSRSALGVFLRLFGWWK